MAFSLAPVLLSFGSLYYVFWKDVAHALVSEKMPFLLWSVIGWCERLMPFAADSVQPAISGGALHWGPMRWAIDEGSSAVKTARDVWPGNFR